MADFPHNTDAERSVLGCCMLDKAACITVMNMLKPEYFFEPRHRTIFTVMVAMFMKGTPIDFITLTDALVQSNDLEASGGGEYVAGITVMVPSVRAAEHYCGIIIEHHKQRKLMSLGNKMSVYFGDGNKKKHTAEEVINHAMKEIISLQMDKSAAEITQITSVVENFIKKKYREHQEGGPALIQTEFKFIDSVTGGLAPGELNVVAARPSVGKTALAEQIGMNVANKGGKVLFVSAEMSNDSLAARVLSRLTGINLYNIRSGNTVFDPSVQDIGITSFYDRNPKVYIYSANRPTDMEVRTATMLASVKYGGLDLVVVDYIQLVRCSDDGAKTQNDRVAHVSSMMKSLAMDPLVNCPVLALSQLSRLSEKEGRMPGLHDLRDSGAIEQDADVIIFLHRESRDQDGDSDLIKTAIAKNRQGRVSYWRDVLEFHKATVSFSDSPLKSG